jgi:integrase
VLQTRLGCQRAATGVLRPEGRPVLQHEAVRADGAVNPRRAAERARIGRPRGLIPHNVAKLVRVPAPGYKVNRGLTVPQAKATLKAAAAHRLTALYVLALYLGLRRGELLGLRWEDVDLDESKLEVVQTLQRVDGSLRLVPPKTDDSARTVPSLRRASTRSGSIRRGSLPSALTRGRTVRITVWSFRLSAVRQGTVFAQKVMRWSAASGGPAEMALIGRRAW